MSDSLPNGRRVSWPIVALNLGLAAAAIIAWKMGAPQLLIGSFVGTAGVTGLAGWRR